MGRGRHGELVDLATRAGSRWWRDATVYQVYVRSFADSDSDGVGDLEGVRRRLDHLELLGVDALWLTPFYRSPMVDHGYDVADPRDVDPLFGDLHTFDRLVEQAHGRGLRVIVDVVPNHTSAEHEWFVAALAAGPHSPERDRYIFRDGKGPDGTHPPNNWTSVFGGPAWTRVADGQWYLHLFAAQQPDLNWDHPQVWADLETTLRFWIGRGVDGFRIDVAHGMAKPPGLPDMPEPASTGSGLPSEHIHDPRFDVEGVHEIHRSVRKVLDEYPDRMAVGEVWVTEDEAFARYLRPDELHQGFNFRLAGAEFNATAVRGAIEHTLAAVAGTGSAPTWTLSNHDVTRPPTRYGGGARGLRRARAMALVELALPGSVYVYNGEELGLPTVDLPHWALHDPAWQRGGHTERGRDGCRVPTPWRGQDPPFGFSDTPDTWLPMPAEWAGLTVQAQLEDADSVLWLYRQALALRREHPGLGGRGHGDLGDAGDAGDADDLEWFGAQPGCLAFRRGPRGVTCMLNASRRPVPLPPGELLLASSPLPANAAVLPPDTAAWLA